MSASSPALHKPTALEVVDGIDLSDKEAIVTGGSSGLGLETARALATAGARVVIAGHNAEAGEAAAAALRAETGNDRIVHRRLDLASLDSVGTWTSRHVATGRPVDILVLNAGVMATPFGRTRDGFETQFGVNHLGHFAFATGLLPALRAAHGARVVSVSSRAHRRSGRRPRRSELRAHAVRSLDRVRAIQVGERAVLGGALCAVRA
ncbi:SDR family NAD(P)-dependent oxidoreductase [Humibacter ginsenosidimutans]|uniref:SDR family NAD(P)-dependent oxidoreductase n=1 Tax=Humibacter ginsenosidimutans TaxID=2599293 RepID=UPI001FEDCF4D|nr:SDR family NAD(P)-dependent oxidoreductase [Humibacter ginsenosidimutans]